MNEAEFAAIAQAEWDAMPERFKAHIENVALLVEDEPSEELRKEEGLGPHETLLGHYHGIPATFRGAGYGVGGTLPDTITLFRLPLLDEARAMTEEEGGDFIDHAARAVRETLWHEVGHYMGLDEHPINEREAKGTNRFES